MTAEVAVMNAEAVALAADSAVTLTLETGHKIFTSANKIFTLSKYYPVGVMVYGNATLMGVPWETVIKRFRAKLGRGQLEHINDYTQAFRKYLESDEALDVPDFAEQHILQNIRRQFISAREAIFQQLKVVVEASTEELPETKVIKVVEEALREHLDTIKSTVQMPTGLGKLLSIREFLHTYGKLVNHAREQVFAQLPFSRPALRQLRELARIGCLAIPLAGFSGFVIAGYGRRDLFPSLRAQNVCWMTNRLAFSDINVTDVPTTTNASVLAFAQKDVVYTFMEGVAREYQQAIESDLHQLLQKLPDAILPSVPGLSEAQRASVATALESVREQIVDSYSKKLHRYRRDRYIRPVTDMVRWLPKEELAAVAESLVNLTSFRRRVTTVPETVGGPIDVAVISKGDGFIWIKRKHYFEPELNPQFLHNYYLDSERDLTYEKGSSTAGKQEATLEDYNED